ncbi:MAG: DUF3842 family protein [Traorella sp.]
MNVLVVDGQGGQLGAQLVKEIRNHFPNLIIMAVGTNAIATANMLKAKAHQAATGENPVIVFCRKADIIIGPIGIVIADSLYGEITPKMALAIGQANAKRILIPINRCDNIVAGVSDLSLSVLLEDVLFQLEKLVSESTK